MSDKPKIYANCKAGCLWETVHKSDFEACATYLSQVPNEAGEFILQAGRTYKIKKASLTDFGFTIKARWSGVSSQTGSTVSGDILFDFLEVDKYEEYLTIRPLDFYSTATSGGLVTVVELDGERVEKVVYSVDDYFTDLTSEFVVVDATECLLLNSDAQIVGIGRGIDRIEEGASGTGSDGRKYQEYIIYYTDGTTHSYVVKDGKDGSGGGSGSTTVLDVGELTTGYLLYPNGVVENTYNESNAITDYIEVAEGSKIVIAGAYLYIGTCIAGYDAEKNWVKDFVTASSVTTEATIDSIDEGITYIRICCQASAAPTVTQYIGDGGGSGKEISEIYLQRPNTLGVSKYVRFVGNKYFPIYEKSDLRFTENDYYNRIPALLKWYDVSHLSTSVVYGDANVFDLTVIASSTNSTISIEIDETTTIYDGTGHDVALCIDENNHVWIKVLDEYNNEITEIDLSALEYNPFNSSWLVAYEPITYDRYKIVYTDETSMTFDVIPPAVKIVQETGESENAVMSQKATTEAIESKANEYFTTTQSSEQINLFDKTRTDYEEGLLNFDGTILDGGERIYAMPVSVGKTYTFPINYGNFGWEGAYYVPCYSASKTYLGYIVASHTDDNVYLTVEITDKFDEAICYVKVNVHPTNIYSTTYIETYMFVEGDTYPSEYYSYESEKVTTTIALNSDIIVSPHTSSPLYKKKIVFAGDSLCHGLTDETGVLGWAQRIGEKYSMNWSNKAISGGTMTSGLESSAGCIADTDFGTSPDYIILEGGTNDTAIGGKDTEGNFPTAFGSYDIKNYGYKAFDKTTFCGAVEYLFERIVTNYTNAKVGFIIAHKQGGWADGAYYGYDAANNTRRQYYETIIALCKKWGIPYIDLWEGCYLNPSITVHNSGSDPFYYNEDRQHLKAKGYDYITPMIESWIESL